MNLKGLKNEIESLAVFDSILKTDVMIKFKELLNCEDEDLYVDKYCRLVSAIYKENPNFSRFIYDYVMNDENIFILRNAKNKNVSKAVEASVERELKVLEKISRIASESLIKAFNLTLDLPLYETSRLNIKSDYYKRVSELPKKGYGIFAKYYVFGVDENGLFPIKHPDKQSLAEMTGYERERNLLIKNTLAFVNGMKANNALLYGDAGTGKSSSVKAIVNEYYPEGLRLIEVKKHQISYLPDVIESLSANPLKFIIFIDDLSFSSNDDDFIALKNILEGGTASNKSNIVVYATSNRRHFIKENFKDREGGELFRNDSIQETMSLAARFGLTITFQQPAKTLYLEIVKNLAKEYKLVMKEEELFTKAEAFAIRNNGRSPRTAKQFIEFEKINKSIKE